MFLLYIKVNYKCFDKFLYVEILDRSNPPLFYIGRSTPYSSHSPSFMYNVLCLTVLTLYCSIMHRRHQNKLESFTNQIITIFFEESMDSG